MNKVKKDAEKDTQNKSDIEMPPLPLEDTVEQKATEQSEEIVVATEEPQKKGVNENIRELRKAKESAERDRDEMRRTIEELKSSQATTEKQVAQVNQQEEADLRPDDIPEWRHVDKHIKKLESKLAQYEKQTQMHTAESRLKTQYPDFDSIVSSSNIEQLREKYPELAATLNSSTDLYSKAVAAYTMIKRLGIAQEDTYGPDRERALKNSNKPRPLASVAPQQGESPLSRANAFAEGLTDELKEQLRREMNEAIKYR